MVKNLGRVPLGLVDGLKTALPFCQPHISIRVSMTVSVSNLHFSYRFEFTRSDIDGSDIQILKADNVNEALAEKGKTKTNTYLATNLRWARPVRVFQQLWDVQKVDSRERLDADNGS